MDLQNKKVCFIGDSITYGHGTSATEKRYTDVFARLTGAIVKNYGINATRIARQQVVKENRDRLSYCERYGEIDHDADVIVILGGTNDYGHGDAPFGDFSEITPDTFCGALRYLCEHLLAEYTNATVVLATPIHRAMDARPCNNTSRPLVDYCRAIKEAGERYGIPVIDLYATSGICPDIPANREAFCPDGLHPNDTGSEKLARRLQAFFTTI